MQSGKLALLSSDSGSLSSNHFEHSLPDSSPFDTASASIQIEESFTLKGGMQCFIGRAAQEDVERTEISEVSDDGTIKSRESSQLTTRVTSFLLVPDSFLVVSGSKGGFLLPMLSEHTDHTPFPAEISVGGFAAQFDDAEYWKVGFQGRANGAQNGVLHGDAVLEDTEFGDVVGISDKNQIGVDFEYNGDLLKAFITMSGYIEIYQPGSFETQEFAGLIDDVILDHARME